MAPQCQALNLSDENRCSEEATRANGLFCYVHSRQVHGLYKGYKRRNASLDHLLEDKPLILATDGLRTDFNEVEDEAQLKEAALYRIDGKARPREEVEEDFNLWMDRERARWLKNAWHDADLAPNARANWAEYHQLRDHGMAWAVDYLKDNTLDMDENLFMKQAMRLVSILEGTTDVHRRVMRSASGAVLLIDLFFDDDSPFWKSEFGRDFVMSRLRREHQGRRALQSPDTRSFTSCVFRNKSQFTEWDKILKITPDGPSEGPTPKDWESITRPPIAHLYKSGVIGTCYSGHVRGYAISLSEPGREAKPDLYFDYRHGENRTAAFMENPYKHPPLLERARAFAAKLKKDSQGTKKPVFTLLRLWSAPHFWPLMIGYDNRDAASFIDTVGRYWEWKFVPKDMPHAEYSMHHTARMRLNDYRDYFGGEELTINGRDFWTKNRGKPRVEVLKDMYLVMGESEEDCRNLTQATVYAIESRPWRWEVDPWKSFWKVDLEFLEGLDEKWWE